MRDEERPYSADFEHVDARLTVHGEIGELDTAQFRRDLLEAVARTERPVIVDLSDVDFLPSMAIGVLVGAVKGSAGQIELVAAKGSIAAHLLQICGLPHADPGTLRPAK
jgi:anti-anti-sigma factor